MGRLAMLLILAGCSAYPQVNWPAGAPGPAPALLPIQDLMGADAVGTGDAAGAALAAQVAALKARVAEGG